MNDAVLKHSAHFYLCVRIMQCESTPNAQQGLIIFIFKLFEFWQLCYILFMQFAIVVKLGIYG